MSPGSRSAASATERRPRAHRGARVDAAGERRGGEPAGRRARPDAGAARLGAGNHFLEVQVVDEVVDDEVAAAWGVEPGQVTVMIHSGSRGFGHQVCTDHLQRMASAVRRYGIRAARPAAGLRAGQLAGGRRLPRGDGRRRQLRLRQPADACCTRCASAFEQVFGRPWERLGIELLYDVAHNIAKLETHDVDGVPTRVWVHRKGATRAFGPGHPDLPPVFQRDGAAGDHPGRHGHRELAARRHREGDGARASARPATAPAAGCREAPPRR